MTLNLFLLMKSLIIIGAGADKKSITPNLQNITNYLSIIYPPNLIKNILKKGWKFEIKI